MPQTIRAFIAVNVPPPPPLKPVLARLGEMGSALKPVAAENLHVTLKFLGEIEPDAVHRVGTIVQRVAEENPAFSVRLVGLSAFPHARRPNVIWAGFREAEPLTEIAEGLQHSLEPLGLPAERRKFEPHLTLARVKFKPPSDLFDLLGEHLQTDLGTVAIDELILYQSELTREGPRHTPLSTAPLEGPRR